jgi:hypothetical protein
MGTPREPSPPPFRARHSRIERAHASERARKHHPGHVPAILVRGGRDAPQIDKEKFLLPHDLTGAQLQYVVRRRLRSMPADRALFLMCDDVLVPATTTARELDAAHRDPDDGFLYVTYALENAFGGS